VTDLFRRPAIYPDTTKGEGEISCGRSVKKLKGTHKILPMNPSKKLFYIDLISPLLAKIRWIDQDRLRPFEKGNHTPSPREVGRGSVAIEAYPAVPGTKGMICNDRVSHNTMEDVKSYFGFQGDLDADLARIKIKFEARTSETPGKKPAPNAQARFRLEPYREARTPVEGRIVDRRCFQWWNLAPN